MRRALLAAAAFAVVTMLLPAHIAGRQVNDWYGGDDELHRGLADSVDSWIGADLDRAGFSTGSDLFDGEWLFGTFQMAGLGYAQLARLHPEEQDRYVRSLEAAIDGLLREDVRAFDAERWGSDPLDDLDRDDTHHAAYLGYTGLVLGLHRELVPDSRFAEVHDRIADALARRLTGSRLGLLETYPGEVYPVDNTAVIATVVLHARATGTDRSAVVDAATSALEQHIDSQTGLLIQAISSRDGTPRDAPRGSGTALAAYFLSLADLPLAAPLASAVRDELSGAVMGFGLVREYPRGVPGRGDIDSGPVLAGFGVSATGFAIANARLVGDRAWFGGLVRTATLFGAPRDGGFLTGGPLGNAIMLAMLTAPAGEGA